MGALSNVYVDAAKQSRDPVTITNVGTTATVTLSAHGFSLSDTVKIQGATQAPYNGNFVISNVTTNTFDYTMPSDPGGNATGSPLCSKLNLSGADGSSEANAFADLQFALDNYTVDASNGNHFLGKGSEVLTASLSIPSGHSFNDPIAISPINSTGWTIDGSGNSIVSQAVQSMIWQGNDEMTFRLTNFGANYALSVTGNYCSIDKVRIDNGTGGACYLPGIAGSVTNCWIEADGDAAVRATRIIGNWIKHTSGFEAIYPQSIDSTVSRNIVTVSGSTIAINVESSAYCSDISNNSILSTGGTGKGIRMDTLAGIITLIENNLVQGFSGTGGAGIDTDSNVRTGLACRNNASHDNATHYSLGDFVEKTDNETPGALFAQSGANTFANRFAYFEPNNVGNVRGGSKPPSLGLDKGAIQHAGGASNIIIPNARR